jgi:hypothetical protein
VTVLFLPEDLKSCNLIHYFLGIVLFLVLYFVKLALILPLRLMMVTNNKNLATGTRSLHGCATGINRFLKVRTAYVSNKLQLQNMQNNVLLSPSILTSHSTNFEMHDSS